MTAPGPTATHPEQAAAAVRRPVAALWTILLAGLVALLPCALGVRAVAAPAPVAAAIIAGPATAAGPAAATVTPAEHHARTTPPPASTVVTVQVGDAAKLWCAVDDAPQGPGSCSSHPFNGVEAQLPNAPPQPAAVLRPGLIGPPALPGARPIGVLLGPDHAPDLHVLQVHRT